MNRPFGLVVVSFVLLAVSLLRAPSPVGQGDSDKMTRISARIIGPRAETTPTSHVKTYWRSGTKYARIAEVPDPQHHIQALVVIHEPDVWMINLFSKSGRHIVDPGPSLNVHIPIFQAQEGMSKEVSDLEFGREREYFAKYHERESLEDLNGSATERQEANVGDNKLVLWIDTKSRKPVLVNLTHNSKTLTVEYLNYQDGLAFDPSLFRPPEGISIENVK